MIAPAAVSFPPTYRAVAGILPHVTFIEPDGRRRVLEAKAGTSLLDIAWDNGIDMEGACGGVMACSTCHVVVEAAFHDRLVPPEDDELDMLDLAYGLTPTSRLACQIALTHDLDGLVVSLPAETHNLLND
jgi:ferredoxin